ncbi:hypothetical protein AYK25_08095 [Thermoplasmatales archaeon SM1-50]|nr:MAG: hypothetical protein AYK25_08095 [Thermoplasmatales archaeon SM1-50]
MPHIREILNEIKWTKDLRDVTVWYIHRGALRNMKCISGVEITGIGKSFLETTSASIPYHRIVKIMYGNNIVFNRFKLHQKDKQL